MSVINFESLSNKKKDEQMMKDLTKEFGYGPATVIMEIANEANRVLDLAYNITDTSLSLNEAYKSLVSLILLEECNEDERASICSSLMCTIVELEEELDAKLEKHNGGGDKNDQT